MIHKGENGGGTHQITGIQRGTGILIRTQVGTVHGSTLIRRVKDYCFRHTDVMGSSDIDKYKSYLNRWIKFSDEDAYHSLTEYGAACAIWLCSEFGQRRSPEDRIKIIELAKEIRDVHTFNLLCLGASDPSKRVWAAALEGLAYQGQPGLLQKLLEIRDIADLEKRKRIEDILNYLQSNSGHQS